MEDFEGKLGVITGAGTGIGRELARQLVGEGCRVALCDIVERNLDDTISLCLAQDAGTDVSGFVCDVADERQVLRFCDHVRETHRAGHIDLLVNNAGISGGGSFIRSTREEWERTFDICWSGVYLMTRAFMPMLVMSADGHIVNVSSANAIRAVLGGHVPHTAYSAAKFAVRGFSEALIEDFRVNAPHLKVSVVMPGHVGTEIMTNSARILGRSAPSEWTDEDVREARARWSTSGPIDPSNMDDDQVREAGEREIRDMRRLGLSPAEAARVILEGVRNDRWRIVVGTDSQSLDALVRESPDTAYDPDFVLRWREANKALIEASRDEPTSS